MLAGNDCGTMVKKGASLTRHERRIKYVHHHYHKRANLRTTTQEQALKGNERMNTASTSTPLLKNKRAVIFGAGGAVGTAVAKEFAAQGATVFPSGRTLNAVEQLAADIHQDDGVAYAAQVDALDDQAVQAYLDRVAQEGGSVDVLLNVVGRQP